MFFIVHSILYNVQLKYSASFVDVLLVVESLEDIDS